MNNNKPEITGAEALDAVVRVLKRFVYLRRDEDYDALALWIAHTYVFKSFKYTPRLAFTSRGPGCGKTFVMELTGLMVANLKTTAAITTPALRIEASRQPTLALDEADVFFGATGKRHEDARAIMNAGYERKGTLTTAVSNGADTREWNVFCPMMFAGIGKLPLTVQDRAITITMVKPPKNTQPERWNDRQHENLVVSAGETLGQWVRSVAPELADVIPDLVPGVDDMRKQRIAEPLLVIGEIAGDGWKERAQYAIGAAFTDSGDPANIGQPLDVQLLADLQTVFKTRRMLVSTLVRALLALPDRPWGDLWTEDTAAEQLAAMLAPFGIKTRDTTIDGEHRRVYYRSDFVTLWAAKLAEEVVPA